MRKSKGQEEGAGPIEEAVAQHHLTPDDIQAREFRLEFRGYHKDDVDAFLDELTSELSSLLEERRRLRGERDAGDLVETSRAADEILSRAREEAAATVREAEMRAALGGTAPDPAASGAAAVSQFLSVEREFLQNLAGLIQGHAETVKGMVRSVHHPPPPSSETEGGSTVILSEAAGGQGEEQAEEPAGEGVGEEAGDHPRSRSDEPPAGPEPVRAPGSGAPLFSSGAEQEGEGEPRARGDRSLRELFWGED